jgi:hypothetical protein
MGMVWQWMGAWWLLAPVLLWIVGRTDPRARGLLPMLLVLLALTAWQRRWGYFVALSVTMSVPFQLAVVRKRWAVGLMAGLALLPLLWGWSAFLSLDEKQKRDRAQRRATDLEFRRLAELMRSDKQQPFLAPWWQSPAIAYWSDQPGVAGSSHQSMPGIVDSARFYLSEKPEEAAAILRERGVHWVIVDDAPIANSRPVRYAPVDNASRILDRSISENALGWNLAENFHRAPPFLRYVTPEERGLVLGIGKKKDGKVEETSMKLYEPQLLQLYEVLPDKL